MRTDTDTFDPSEGRGQDDRLVPAPGAAGKIINFRWHPEGWWANDRGWEPLLVRPTAYEYPADYLAPVRGLWVWTRHQGAEVYYLYERAGVLQYDFGNNIDAVAPAGQVILSEGRHIPGPADPGTQMIPFGRFALFLNGYDAPAKFFGGNVVTPFSWPAAPAPPVVAPVDPLGMVALLSSAGNSAKTSGTFIAELVVVPPFLGVVGNVRSSYGYRVTWVSETGAESPYSAEVVVEWKPNNIIAELFTYAVWLSSLPVGPDHVVARRVYRTKNLADQDGLVDRTYYFVAEIPDNCSTSWVDVNADARLTVVGPTFQDSAPIPPGLRYGCAFDGRLWLGGGSHSPTRVYYSETGLPEQFPTFNYFDLGNVSAGDITQIVAHEGQVYIFRERGIDVIRVTDQLQYQVVNLSGTIGTTASNTICAVPGFGLVFLSRDGVRVVNAQGIRKLSQGISDEIARLGAGSLARATAVYSPREEEWWVQYPADGAAENTRGAVLHTALSTLDAPAWSLRHVPPTDGTSLWRSIVTALAVDPDGWVIFGTSPINTTDGTYPGTSTFAQTTVGDTIEGLGLQVWTARPAGGTVYTVTAKIEGFVTSRADGEPLEAIWQSPWLQYPARGRVVRVEAWVVNTGRPSLTLEHAVNGREEWTAISAQVEMAPFETSQFSSNDHIYSPDTFAQKRGYRAVWGTSKWREDRLVRVTWDIARPEGAVQSFAFRLRSSDVLGIRAYRVGASDAALRTGDQHRAALGTS